jgi:hypothetical protein
MELAIEIEILKNKKVLIYNLDIIEYLSEIVEYFENS